MVEGTGMEEEKQTQLIVKSKKELQTDKGRAVAWTKEVENFKYARLEA